MAHKHDPDTPMAVAEFVLDGIKYQADFDLFLPIEIRAIDGMLTKVSDQMGRLKFVIGQIKIKKRRLAWRKADIKKKLPDRGRDRNVYEKEITAIDASLRDLRDEEDTLVPLRDALMIKYESMRTISSNIRGGDIELAERAVAEYDLGFRRVKQSVARRKR